MKRSEVSIGKRVRVTDLSGIDSAKIGVITINGMAGRSNRKSLDNLTFKAYL